MSALSLASRHAVSRLLHAYADWRIGATEAEKHCHKQTDSILLTFDDYGTPKQIADILHILADKQVKALFFINGDWANDHVMLVDAIRSAGHIVGNHTYSHADLLSLSDHLVTKEIIGGIPGRWLRAPQGRSNARIRRLAQRLGFSLCYWTIDSRDWTGASVATMKHTILSELRPGSVVLFHIHGQHTRQLLPSLIEDIRRRGFNLTAPSETW